MKTTRLRKVMTIIMVVAMVITSIVTDSDCTDVRAASLAGIITNPTNVDEADSYTTTLDSGETATISIKNKVLFIKVDSKEYTFKIGDRSDVAYTAVINIQSNLLHIITLGKDYYVFDLNTGL